MKNSFVPPFVTNLFGTMNDNFLKTLASFTVIGWIQDASLRPMSMGITASRGLHSIPRHLPSRRFS